MKAAKKGDKVKVHYTGTLDNGTVFDSSVDREPLEFTVGEGMVIAGFDEAVAGMQVGETKSVHIPCEQAYGEHHAELAFDIDRRQMPPSITPEVGMQLSVKLDNGGNGVVCISKIEGDTVTLDGNHPLAGKNLNFELSLVAIG